ETFSPLIYKLYVQTQTIYQFPPSVKVRSGERVSMHCQLNEVQSFCHTVAWVRVHPVSGMIDILQDSNIPRQTKEQVETTVCQASIYNATVQDSGTYYCITTDREHMYLGNGTAVTVQAGSAVMPSIDIMAFASSNKRDSTVTLQCTVGEFVSSRVYVHWLIGSRKENGQTLFLFQNIFKFYISEAKILTYFPEDKISSIYPYPQIQKVFTPGSQCMVFPSGASSECLNIL
uniref:Ig-like domain-containing protein n=1 Tax=Cyprinus carpio TaxID=7962 RepID=A0A8C1Y0Y9_CYPCA